MRKQLQNLLVCFAALAWLGACSASRHSEEEIVLAAPAALGEIVQSLKAELRADPDEPELQVLLARALLRSHKADDAESLALEATRRLPFDGTVMNLLGDIYLAQHKRFRALTAFSEAVALEPDLLTAYVSLGRVRHLLDQDEEAESALGEALRREPSYYPAQFEMSRLLFVIGEPERAAQVVAAARRIRPGAPEAQLLEIQINKAQGKLTVAAYLVAQALRERPGSTALRRESLDIHVQRQNWGEAIRLLNEMEAGGSLATEDALVKAEVLRGAGRQGEADRLLQALLRRAPNHPGVVLAGARASIVRGDAAAALRPLQGAVEQDPKSAQAYYWKAVAHYQLGQDIQGNASLDIATTLAPKHPPIRLLRVRRLLSERNLSEARLLLNAHLSDYPGDGNALLVRSELSTLLGNYQDAERDMRGIVPATTDSALRFARARLAYLRKEYRAVLVETTAMVKQASSPWQAAYLHSAALMRLGRGSQALPLLQARLRRGQGGGEIHRLVGDIHHLAGARGKAEAVYRTGQEKFPRNTRLMDALARLAMEAGKWKQARNWLEAALERPGGMKSLFLERLRFVYLKLKQPGRAKVYLERYLAQTDPLVRERESLGEQRILFNKAFPAIGYSTRYNLVPAQADGSGTRP